jgi:hypothetical protein
MFISLIGTSPIKLSFTNKLMTAYGGFALLSKLFDRLDLANETQKMIPFAEVSPNSTGVFAKILKLGLTVAAGGSRYTHAAFLGDSHEIYEKTFGIKKMPKSITAVTRFFNRFEEFKQAEFFSEQLWDFLLRKVIPLRAIKEDVLTFDSTVLTRYGEQQGAKKGYNPKKKGRKSHHPLLAFLNRSRYIVNLWNRAGDTSSSNGIVGFANQTIERLSGRLESIKMVIADSGFYKAEFLDQLEEKNLPYVISAPLHRSLQNQIFKMKEWQDAAEGISIGEFSFKHRDEKWQSERRYIVVRKDLRILGEATPGKILSLFPEEDEAILNFKYGIYVTSSQADGLFLWREYRLRANDENIIKETKEDFGLEGFSQKKFYATEVSMLIRIMFYNILNLFRQEMLSQPESSERISTLRLRYFLTPAVLGKNGKSPVLRLGLRKQSRKHKFLYILHRISAYFDKCIAFGPGLVAEEVKN